MSKPSASLTLLVVGFAFLSGCGGQLTPANSALDAKVVKTVAATKLGQLDFYRAVADRTAPQANIVLGSDQNLWYETYDKHKGYAVTKYTASGEQAYYLPLPCASCTQPGIENLVTGPDGRIWIGNSSGHYLGAVDTSGNFTYYDLSAVCEYPYSDNCTATLGASLDGNVWFVTQSLYASNIGYINANSGMLKQVTFLSRSSNLTEITLGSDGNLWLGYEESLVRIRPGNSGSYQISSFPTKPAVTVEHLVSGSDGALWFDDGAGTVGRMNTSGKMLSEKKFGSSGPSATLAVGPDGKVWGTNTAGVVQLTGSKTLQSIKTPTKYSHDCAPDGLVIGADGNLWFDATSIPKTTCSYGIGAVVAK